ncbi:MAG TPA: cytochrome b/b6 domain-containing protein [Burkholderiales bacterium]|nr:cytochrome b/b6 domain-containing protein [Burkholderiales bacterium]
MSKILVWDLPVRVGHWTLAGSFAAAYATGDSEAWRNVHVAAGLVFAATLAFRILWGLAGTRYARFSSFVRGPGAVFAYLRSLLTVNPQHWTGHNPAGGWAILALLGLGLVTALSGLAAYNEFGGEWLEELHEGAAGVMLALVGMHLAGVLVGSLAHRENLVRAMFTGYKQGESVAAIRRQAWIAAGLQAAWITLGTMYLKQVVG